MSLDKQTIESRVVDYYLNSRDYNGLPVPKLAKSLGVVIEDVLDLAVQMVKAGRIFIPSPYQTNPFIKVFDAPVDEQLLHIDKRDPGLICPYPTEAAISDSIDVSKYDDKPFTRLMVLANPKFLPFKFQLDVLDAYHRDPRYDFYFYDFGGRIQTAETSPGQLHEQDKVELRFGVGYGDKGERMVVVYLYHLASLPEKHQQIFKQFLTDESCHVAEEFVETSIFGRFPKAISIYDAIIQEQAEINKQFEILGRAHLFRKTFEDHRRPREFSFFIKPTQRNYEEFVLTLDNMLSENINLTAFGSDVCRKRRVKHNSGEIEVRFNGSIAMLEEWLSLQCSALPNVDIPDLVEPLKKVRKLRQEPAHSLTTDRYDNHFYVLQDELVGKVYVALHGIRCLLAQDPAHSTYEPPFWDGFFVKSY